MKAVVIKSPGEYAVEDVPKPEPAEGEVLLKVEACAICGTDQRVMKGEKAVSVPIVGHEIVGTATAAGAGVDSIELGVRYVIQPVFGCGLCEMCLDGRENLCEAGPKSLGYHWNGGFAEYVVMPKIGVDCGNLVPVPNGMPSDVATLIEPLGCCINGMRTIPLEECGHVVIFGGGVIGVLNGLVAKARGAGRITIVDVSPDRLSLLRDLDLPFDDYLNGGLIDIEEWVEGSTSGKGVDAAIVAASVPTIVPTAVKLLARDGHLSIFAGMPKSNPEIPLDLNLIHYRELHVHGANGSALRDARQAVEYLESRRVDGAKLVTHRFDLRDFEEAMAIQSDPASGALKVVITT